MVSSQRFRYRWRSPQSIAVAAIEVARPMSQPQVLEFVRSAGRTRDDVIERRREPLVDALVEPVGQQREAVPAERTPPFLLDREQLAPLSASLSVAERIPAHRFRLGSHSASSMALR